MNEPLPNPVVRKLKALAQKLEPVLALGKSGASDAFIKSLDEALAQHELVKIRLFDLKDKRHEIGEQVARESNSHLVTVIGHVVVLYRPKPDQAAPTDSAH